MNFKQKLQASSYTSMVQNFAAENFNMKILSGACLALLFLSLIVIAFLLKQGPQVVALDASGAVISIETKVTDAQILTAMKEYIDRRYSWSHVNIDTRLRQAEFFVDSDLLPNFRKSMLETVKFVREKKVTQRVYPRSVTPKVDLKEKSVAFELDRFTEFDSLKAATEMKIKVWFQIGSRTPINPWGVYVVREQETGDLK